MSHWHCAEGYDAIFPADGEMVLCCWMKDGKPLAYESLTFRAADSYEGSDVWEHWDGEKADAPCRWLSLDAIPTVHR